MSPEDSSSKKKGRGFWVFMYVLTFVVGFGSGALSKSLKPSWTKNYTVDWNDSIGKEYANIPYGPEKSNTFDLYVPAEHKKSYGLVVYLHAGGFTTGDKSDDRSMLEWLCSKGYVTAGINYTLRNEANPQASVYAQSLEIKESIPVVIAEAKKLGYPINEMAIGGGSAGHTLALLYAYRDAHQSPVPVKMVFGAVGPSSFYPEDWTNYGLDKDTPEVKEAAAGLFGIMAGKTITSDLFGPPAYDEAMKDISPLLWVKDDTVPTLMAYGQYDKVQPFKASIRLDQALTDHHVPHDYLVLKHSGHGLQNDNNEFHEYYEKLEEYLNGYMPVK